jgi:hypothetical protein
MGACEEMWARKDPIHSCPIHVNFGHLGATRISTDRFSAKRVVPFKFCQIWRDRVPNRQGDFVALIHNLTKAH